MNSLKTLHPRIFFRYFVTVKHPTERNQKLEALRIENQDDLQTKNKVDADTIALLERLSLVDCMSKEEIKTLEAAIDFADQILEVDTTNVEPMVTVLEDFPLQVREDTVTEGNCREAILKNAVLKEEEYFVAPPGNIPVETRTDLLYDFNSKNKS